MSEYNDYYGQAAQDYFVLKCTNQKVNGFFLEIGSHHPIDINNSFLLEKKYNWRGILVDMDPSFEGLYESIRPVSKYFIQDATTIRFGEEMRKLNFPSNVDYLQIDLEAGNGSTLQTLENLHSEAMNDFTFAVVTFEHDIYTGDHYNTRQRSRDIFASRGYIRVYSDVKNGGVAYEDWYVHPSLVDMSFINKIKRDESLEWTEILGILRNN
jgi:hypothetical protein